MSGRGLRGGPRRGAPVTGSWLVSRPVLHAPPGQQRALRLGEVVGEPRASVIDQDVKRLDLISGCLDLRRAGEVQGQRRDPPVGVGQRLAGAGIYPVAPLARASATSA